MSGETEEQVSGWTTDTLHSHLVDRFRALEKHLDERYATQTKAIDAAFAAQQEAMKTALVAADHAVAAALASAEKAVDKAEAATERRLEAVNEFRSQLADVIHTLMPRSEAEAVIARNTERIQELTLQTATFITREEMATTAQRNTERIQELADRVNKTESHGAGLHSGWVYLLSAIAALGTIFTIIVIVNGG